MQLIPLQASVNQVNLCICHQDLRENDRASGVRPWFGKSNGLDNPHAVVFEFGPFIPRGRDRGGSNHRI